MKPRRLSTVLALWPVLPAGGGDAKRKPSITNLGFPRREQQ